MNVGYNLFAVCHISVLCFCGIIRSSASLFVSSLGGVRPSAMHLRKFFSHSRRHPGRSLIRLAPLGWVSSWCAFKVPVSVRGLNCLHNRRQLSNPTPLVLLRTIDAAVPEVQFFRKLCNCLLYIEFTPSVPLCVALMG